MKRQWKWWDTTRRDPEAYIACLNMVPNINGNYEAAREALVYGSGNTLASVIAADAVLKTDGTARLFACTATKIYEITSSAATDRSLGGGTYTSGTDWQCAQFGDVTLYTNRANVVQSSSSGAFANLAGTPPKAKYICTQSLAVALAAYNDGVNTYEDGIWISDIGDQTTWTPSSSNEASNFRLLQTPGAITGIVAFKGDILAFKANSIYRISYVGGDLIWQSQLINDNIGAATQGLICVCGDVVVFLNENGWYVFDGSGFTMVAPGNVRGNYGGASPSAWGNVSSYYEPSTGLAHFSDTNGVAIVVFQTRTRMFGYYGIYGGSGSQTNVFIRGSHQALTGTVSSASATTGFSAGAMTSSGGNYTPASLEKEWGTNSTGTAASVTTSFFGSPLSKTTIKRVVPMLGYYASQVANPSLTLYAYGAQATNLSDQETSVTGVASSGEVPRFDLFKSARFISLKIAGTTKAFELEDLVIDSRVSGTD